MKFEEIAAEAASFDIMVSDGDGLNYPIKFWKCGYGDNILAWMYRKSRSNNNWTGYTRCPEITGTINGSKAKVADWCVNWSVNGF